MADGKAKHINSSEFGSEISQGITLVDFWAEWCGPCRMIAPAIEELASELEGKVKIAKLDVDANPEVASQYNVQGIPTMILFKDGQEVDRLVGAAPKAGIAEFISKNSN